ncbi:MAG: peptidase C45 [marine bacterium B5-7]|nr:MAG: peptidase C45 [marine bacterium B5-7]
MQLRFQSVYEPRPDGNWLKLLSRHWSAYEKWFLSEGDAARPSYLKTRQMLRKHMPELMPTYERLVDLAGGSDMTARFLGHYCPPPYISGCSQAIWPDPDQALLIRNYDYSPSLCEGTLLYSCWNGRKVIAMSDCLWGVLDGMNDAGLAVSLSFGGRRVVGEGFGVPLILRYILEFCETVEEATRALGRIPTHMSYNVTVLDKSNQYRTAFVSPDRRVVIRQLPVATNHQGRVEWQTHAEATASTERESFLINRLADSEETEGNFIDSFLQPPLYSTAYKRGFGTLYTAWYRPQEGEMALMWPGSSLVQNFTNFTEESRTIRYDGITEEVDEVQASQHERASLMAL